MSEIGSRPAGWSAGRRGDLVALALAVVLLWASAPRAGSAASSPAGLPLTGSYPVLFLLCDFTSWRDEPGRIADDRAMWTEQHRTGVFSSLADYFHDESYGKLDLKGSQVRGWYHMNVSPNAWYSSAGAHQINGDRLSVRWLACVNAAEAASMRPDLLAYRAIVAVTPYVAGRLAGNGLPAQQRLRPGQKTPPTQRLTLDSTKGWPHPPFQMTIKEASGPFTAHGEDVLVTGMRGRTVTIRRGYNEGLAQLTGPFPAVAPGSRVVTDTSDDFAYVGPIRAYLQRSGQRCSYNHRAICPSVTLSRVTRASPARRLASNLPFDVGAANLFAGDDRHDGNVSAGVGNSAHEVGHTTGYDHSRALSSSTTEYGDCYDQMSYNTCGTPHVPGEAGPASDGVIGYDAINLELHGWIPHRFRYNPADRALTQATITLHALSDPDALRSAGQYLDAHIPAHVRIEDVSPNATPPTTPATCTHRQGYRCVNSDYYTVEYRQRYGFDASLRQRALGDGNEGPPAVGAVVLHLYAPDARNPDGNISYLVDSFPGRVSRSGRPAYLPDDGGLQPGDDYADPAHHTYVAVNGFDGHAFTATVTLSSAKLRPKLTLVAAPPAAEGTAPTVSPTVSARLTVDGAPVPAQPVNFATGSGQTCGPVMTDGSGGASCQMPAGESRGFETITATFAGDSAYLPASASSTSWVWSGQTAGAGAAPERDRPESGADLPQRLGVCRLEGCRQRSGHVLLVLRGRLDDPPHGVRRLGHGAGRPGTGDHRDRQQRPAGRLEGPRR